MAVYRITYTLHATSGLVEDDVVNGFYFETSEGDATSAVGAALCGHVSAAYSTVTAPGTVLPTTKISREISRTVNPTIRAYEIAGGSPIAMATSIAIANGDSIDGLPSEVACCLSFNASLTDVPEVSPDDPDADSAPERPASRRRGRIFFGPLTAQATNQQSPALVGDALRDALLGMAKFLATPTAPALTAVDAKWSVYSPTDGDARPVVRASVDNVFDTQRRRGRAATLRTVINLP